MKLLMWLSTLLASCLPSSQAYGDNSRFSVMPMTQCVDKSMSVWSASNAASIINCIMKSLWSGIGAVGVVQWNTRDATCALFRFSQVCHLLNLKNLAAASSGDCETVIDSKYNAAAANEHFAAVWVGDRGPTLENLVCGATGQKNSVNSMGVDWTGEGIRMDGTVTAKMWVDDIQGIDFNNSFTWVLRMKRTPKANCFLELTDCATSSAVLTHFWEYSISPGVSSGTLFLNLGNHGRYQSNGDLLPNNAQDFFVAGFAFDKPANQIRFYYQSTFVAAVPFGVNENFWPQTSCIHFGWRKLAYGSGTLNGVIGAVAVANSALSVDAIARLFANV